MAVLVLIFTVASAYIFSILAIKLQRSEPLLMSSVTEGTRGLLINFLPFALMTIILAVTDCSICYVADAVLSLAYLRFTTEGLFDLIFLAASAGTLALNIIAAMIHASAICIACEYIFSETKESPEEEEMTMEIKQPVYVSFRQK